MYDNVVPQIYLKGDMLTFTLGYSLFPLFYKSVNADLIALLSLETRDKHFVVDNFLVLRHIYLDSQHADVDSLKPVCFNAQLWQPVTETQSLSSGYACLHLCFQLTLSNW